ncbi:MAG TPA: hypothetical protein VM915_13555, partial [Verrucomicrobiae bacterium]|nr:hypothetical protein [Verrucomicrobiae bacterium]
MAHAIEYRRLRAPREHGQTLIDPPLSSVAALIAQNQSSSQAAYANVFAGEISLAELRQAAREELFAAAVAYTRGTLGACDVQASSRFILAGHQPELFHPGVWLKNFVLSALGQRHGATAINLIVDNDKAGLPSIRVPSFIDGKAVASAIALDDPLSERAYEERPVLNERLFADFAKAVDPSGARLVTPLWQQMDPAQKNLGLRLAAARHRLEHAHGLRTLEVPLSTVCDTPSFARFALHLLLELPRLRNIYNQALADYRKANHVRSEAHPVPELDQQDQWLEAPLWIWSRERPQRRQAFARRDGDRIIVSDRDQLHVELPLAAGRITQDTIAAWLASAARGIKLRPRALITTMYARLLLSDLFLHGIGGAKYDQLTDAIIEQMFGLTPPHYLTVTGTFKLHRVNAVETAARLREAQHQLHELPYHPEASIAADSAKVQALVEEKRRLVLDPPLKGNRKAWHDAIVALNVRLL